MRLLAGLAPGTPNVPSANAKTVEPLALYDLLGAGVAVVEGLRGGNGIHEGIPAKAWLGMSPVFFERSFSGAGWLSVVRPREDPLSSGWRDLRWSSDGIAAVKLELGRQAATAAIVAVERMLAIQHQLISSTERHANLDPFPTVVPGVSNSLWVGLSLARAMVSKASNYDPSAATDWLTALAIETEIHSRPPRVRSRYRPRSLAELERASIRERWRAQYPCVIENSYDRVIDDPSKDLGCCVWLTPSSVLRFADDISGELSIDHVEWEAEALRRVIDQEFTDTVAILTENETSDTKNAPRRRGPKVKHFWANVLGRAAGWLAANGRPGTQTEMISFLTARIEALGETAEDSTVQIYARELLGGYDQEMAPDR